MKLTQLKLFIHDSKKKNEFYKYLFSLLKKSELNDYIIEKGYMSGYNIQVITKDSNAKQKLVPIIKKFQENVPYRKLSQHEKKLETAIIKKLSRMEEIPHKESQTCLFEEGSYIFETVSSNYLENKFKMRFEELWNVLTMRQRFLNTYFLTQQQKYSEYIYLLLFCFIAADSYPTGIKDGAISYRSNYEYYMKQLNLIEISDTKKQEIIAFINNKTKKELEEEEILISIFFQQKEYINDPVGKSFYQFIDYSKKVISDNFNNNLTFNQTLHTAADFFERIQHPSEFHEKFYKIPEIIKLYENKDFIVHRYILSLLYSIFPLINVSNRNKQKIIGHAASIVESQNNQDIKKAVLSWNSQ